MLKMLKGGLLYCKAYGGYWTVCLHRFRLEAKPTVIANQFRGYLVESHSGTVECHEKVTVFMSASRGKTS